MTASTAGGTLVWPETYDSRGTAGLNPRPDIAEPIQLFDWWIRKPQVQPRPAPQAQTFTRAILEFTGLSHRKLADILKTSHPTIAALEQGKSEAKIADLFDRLSEVYEVTRRLFLIADRDTARVERLMTTPSGTGATAIDLLSERRPAEAYLAALEVDYPHRDRQMMQSHWPARAGEATVDLTPKSM